jgi:hypothetical protein
MYLPGNMTESASIFLRKTLFSKSNMRKVPAQTVTMFDILRYIKKLKNQDRINFLKIDIEGYELPLLSFNNRWLSNVDYIVGEFHTDVYGLVGKKRILETLTKQGFKTGVLKVKINKMDLLKKWMCSRLSPNSYGYLLYRTLTCIKPNPINQELFYGEKG